MQTYVNHAHWTDICMDRQCINVDEAHRKNLHKNPLLTQYGSTGKKAIKAKTTIA